MMMTMMTTDVLPPWKWWWRWWLQWMYYIATLSCAEVQEESWSSSPFAFWVHSEYLCIIIIISIVIMICIVIIAMMMMTNEDWGWSWWQCNAMIIQIRSPPFAFWVRSELRVAKCHRYGRYICVKILRGWGKKCRRQCNLKRRRIGFVLKLHQLMWSNHH